MTPLEIHLAEPGDAPGIARLLDAFNREFDSPTIALEDLERNVRRLLTGDQLRAFIAGRPAQGLALLSFRPTIWGDGPVALLEELYVVPEKRGQGTGRRLMEATLDAVRAAGCIWIEVTTGESDAAARSLYESCGFTNLEDSSGQPRMLYYELDLAGDFIRPQG